MPLDGVMEFPPTYTKIQQDTSKRTILIAVWAVILFGLPIWWTTTIVYRAPLPYELVELWSRPAALDNTFKIHITVHHSGSAPSTLANALAKDLNSAQKAINAVRNPPPPLPSTTRSQSRSFDHSLVAPMSNIEFQVEEEPLSSHDASLPQTAKSLAALDQTLYNTHSDRHGHYRLFVYCNVGTLLATGAPSPDPVSANLHFGQFRNVILQLSGPCSDEQVLRLAVPTIAMYFAQELQDISQSLSSTITPAGNLGGSLAPAPPRPNHDNMRTVKFAPEYQVTFSLLNADPATFTVEWEIENCLQAYFEPLVQRLAPLNKLVISTQILNYATLPIQPLEQRRGNSPTFVLKPEMLGRFINGDWHLASMVSSSPPLNFILYIPSLSQSPLHILDSKGGYLPTNAFLIPRWGGVVIRNDQRALRSKPPLQGQGTPSDRPATSNSPDSVELPPIVRKTFQSHVELKDVMELWVSQLRGILGIHAGAAKLGPAMAKQLPNLLVTHAPSPSGLTLFELDSLLMKRLVQNQVNTMATLQSLCSLVDSLGNMVVQDRIGEYVREALDGVIKSHDSSTESLFASFQHSLHALSLSEKAFFDPSMVPLLYFPDEHKYAVYMPLFVPCAVPLLVGLIKELQSLRARRKKAKTQ